MSNQVTVLVFKGNTGEHNWRLTNVTKLDSIDDAIQGVRSDLEAIRQSYIDKRTYLTSEISKYAGIIKDHPGTDAAITAEYHLTYTLRREHATTEIILRTMDYRTAIKDQLHDLDCILDDPFEFRNHILAVYHIVAAHPDFEAYTYIVV